MDIARIVVAGPSSPGTQPGGKLDGHATSSKFGLYVLNNYNPGYNGDGTALDRTKVAVHDPAVTGAQRAFL
ncbi:hypothetical protein [Paraburkholderia kirstenboschensis]|uniref:Uncharacterized protein n=1 Tax=Paraburkholderia kirstenboschensis TaxID=1245436 RepID=A0ABZ0E987_9BURK|nr:hypothetical protein [Paraburkholderia kirstenboschensis]WOD13789.1 hypothetical protein RW095_07505 [Paraburkholderia kirstenboschensis]